MVHHTAPHTSPPSTARARKIKTIIKKVMRIRDIETRKAELRMQNDKFTKRILPYTVGRGNREFFYATIQMIIEVAYDRRSNYRQFRIFISANRVLQKLVSLCKLS